MDARALILRQERSRRLLYKLLIASLQRAIAGAEHDGVAVAIRNYLRFDMTRFI